MKRHVLKRFRAMAFRSFHGIHLTGPSLDRIASRILFDAIYDSAGKSHLISSKLVKNSYTFSLWCPMIYSCADGTMQSSTIVWCWVEKKPNDNTHGVATVDLNQFSFFVILKTKIYSFTLSRFWRNLFLMWSMHYINSIVPWVTTELFQEGIIHYSFLLNHFNHNNDLKNHFSKTFCSQRARLG